MNSERQGVCAWCAFWHISPPPGWKPPNYAPDCEPHLHDWLEWAREKHNDYYARVNWPVLEGMCGVDPGRVKTKGAHGCSRYIDRHLDDPADIADKYCNRDFFSDNSRDIRRKNEKLKRQVAHHKKLAESRLKRLQAMAVGNVNQ